MAKKAKRGVDAAAAGSGEEPPELRNEVAAFAAQLGLSAAGAADHAFDDFAPQKAQNSAAKPGKRKVAAVEADAAVDTDEDAPPAKPATKKQKQQTERIGRTGKGAKAPQEPADAAVIPPVSDSVAAAMKERGWNTGVGPRPGTQ